MLDVAKIIKKSDKGRFDTVTFFVRDAKAILETQQRIPGAVGYAGNFESIVLLEDDDEDFEEQLGHPLEAPEESPDIGATRQRQHQLETRRLLRNAFPFDILNIDMEGYLFRPKDQIPGRLIRALKKVLDWQKRELRFGKNSESITDFTLMFTTKLGPDNLSKEYLQMISDAIDRNVGRHPDLEEALRVRWSATNAQELQVKDFRRFFLIGAPKLLASTVMDVDWFIDAESGIDIYAYERPHKDGTYTMVHFVMDIARKDPISDHRAPMTNPPEVENAYNEVVKKIFSGGEVVVTEKLVTESKLSPSMDEIIARREIYHRA